MTEQITPEVQTNAEPAMTDGERHSRSVAGVYFAPAVEFIVRFGEIVLIAGAFRFAAARTDSLSIEILAVLMNVALGGFIGLAWGRYILLPLNRIRVRATWINLIPIVASGLAMGWLFFFLGGEISRSAEALISTTSGSVPESGR